MLPAQWSLEVAIAIFVAGAAVTVWGGVRLSRLADQLADTTGWGEALLGTVLLGAATSLSGIVMTAAAAFDGRAGLAYSSAVGGLAAQTAALAVADIAYRRANLEHAAASLFNVFSGVTLIVLLALAAALTFSPEVTAWSIHPGSALLFGAYLLGLKISREVGANPMWRAKDTDATLRDEQEEHQGVSTRSLLPDFLLTAGVVAFGGWGVAEAAGVIVEETGFTETQVGAVLMGITNALPEMVVSIAAVRRGALTLAVAGVVGGNAFDVLNLAIGDLFYRGGSLFHAASGDQLLVLLTTTLMTAILVAGQLRRERQGPGGIGLESTLLIAAYVGLMILISV